MHVAGRGRDAEPVLDELLQTPRLAYPNYASWDFVFVAVESGRGDEWLRATADAPSGSAWLAAGRLVAEGEYVVAAERYAEIGAPFLEAWARLLAAEHGDLDQLEPARAFFTAEGATPFLRRCDAVLAASA